MTCFPAGTAKAGAVEEVGVTAALTGSATEAAVCTGGVAGEDDATGIVVEEWEAVETVVFDC